MAYLFQGALGKQDLGRLHYKPVKDRNGSTVIVAVNYVIVSMELVYRVKIEHYHRFSKDGQAFSIWAFDSDKV